jgi:hypothetical protein
MFEKMRDRRKIMEVALLAPMGLCGVFSIIILLDSDSIASETEHTCKIVEEIRLSSDKKLTYTLCLEEQSRCGHDAGQICSVGLSKEVARKICRWVPKIECSYGIANTQTR